MPTLVIDNYDSFTYNLVHMIADPIVIRNDEMPWESAARLRFDRIVISPGPGTPGRVQDFGISADAIRHAKVPVLGVCLGHQGIAEAFGGRVVRARPVHGYRCTVRHEGDELFAGTPQTFEAIRYHSLQVEQPLPEELKPIAWAEDGTLMALRHRARPIWGVQFHPESVLTEYGRKLLENFGAPEVIPCRGTETSFDRQPFRPNICISYEGEIRHLPREASVVPPASGKPFHPPSNIRYALAKSEYIDRVRQCIEWIRAGETYEICLTNKLLLESDIEPSDYYHRLGRAPYSTFLDLGDRQIASASPECFLKIDSAGRVQSRPIKGTLPSHCDPDELRLHPRFRAENLMIVDLVRNDLAKVCIPGSVHVPRLMEVETYPLLHQLVSTVEGQLRPGVSAMDCVRAAFPGGSMTGAPKRRTMELLRQLEAGPRGVYAGAIGHIGTDGSADLSIVIRTAEFRDGHVSIGTGGAIVADSDPEEEWAELELKASALLNAFMPDESRL